MSQINKMTDVEVKQDKTNKIMQGVNIWAAFYRANPHRFAKDYLGLSLKWFQQIILCMMFRFTNAIYLASRGGGKSFLIAIFCVIYCILYPDTQICVASKTRTQAGEIITKIKTILMPKSANLRLEIDEVQVNQANSFVSFKNGSRITVVTAAESARHNRATILIVDEYRMVSKDTIDTILRRFLTAPRRPGFLDKPEYIDYPIERTKEIYASSCWYESHWSYEMVKSYVVNMIHGRSYFCCAMPYQLAIKENLLDRVRVEDEMSESTFNSMTFQMEMECLFWGQGEGGLYSFEEIDKNRVIQHPFYPKSFNLKTSDKRLIIPPKKPGEKRLLSADIALMASTKKRDNDATSIFVNQMLPVGENRFINNIIYADNNEGLRTDAEALIIRKLFADFDCDYLILDTKGLGLGISDALMADIYDPITGETYGALSCCNNEELAKRCHVNGAPKVIWSIQGNPEFNSQCALGLREALRQKQVRLLISEYEADDFLFGVKGFDSLSPADIVTMKLPYIHTSLLINELIKLEYEVRNNVVRVKEVTGMRKDRYSSLSYNIYVAKAIEREMALKNKTTVENMVFHFRTPKFKKL